jgi:hypothetical protein
LITLAKHIIIINKMKLIIFIIYLYKTTLSITKTKSKLIFEHKSSVQDQNLDSLIELIISPLQDESLI